MQSQGIMQQHHLWQQHMSVTALGAAACKPAQQALPPQQLFQATKQTTAAAPAAAGPFYNPEAAGAAESHPTVFGGPAQQVPAPLQGLCFSMPSTSSDSGSGTADDSSSQHGTSSSSPDSRQAGPHPAARMGTAGLLCDSPGISPECMDTDAPSYPAGLSTKQCTHSQHSKQQAGCGMNNHQVDVMGKPAYILPSLHSMLGGGAASKPKPAPAATAAPAPAAQAASKLMPAQGSRFDSSSGHHLHAAVAMQASPFLSCSSQGAGDSPDTSPFSTSSMPIGHHMPAPATAPAAAGAASTGAAGSSIAGVQGFLAACATPASVAALAVLAYNTLLPVQPVQDAGTSDGAFGPLAATLAYMYVLAGRGDVLRCDMTDTIIHTLLLMTESFFSQYRCSLRSAVYDYCFFTSGLALDDPHFLATWSAVGPPMVALQRHTLAASDFRLVVTEQQLLEAYRTLDGAGSSNPSSSSSSCVSLEAVQRMVDCQVQQYQQWYDSEAERLLQSAQQQQLEEEETQEPQEVAPAMQLFPGEQITGMLVAEQSAVPALGSLHACGQQQQEPPKQRQALHDISNTSVMQLPPAAKPLHSAAQHSSAGKPPAQQEQQQPGRPRTRQQHKQHNQQNAGPAHAASRAASSKQVLLQLASREQAVGSKRRRDTAAAAGEAAAATSEPLSSSRPAAAVGGSTQGNGVAGGFGAGGKRMLLKVMRTAQSAAQYFGCRQ